MSGEPNVRPANRTAPASGDDRSVVDVDAILRGDQKAFEALVIAESPRLYRLLLRIVRDPDETRSVMQETFLQAYKRLETFRGDAKLTTWLYGIGINQARAALRRMRRYHTLDERDIDRLQPSFHGGMYADRYQTWSPDRLAELGERRRLVREAIDRLPDNYRMVIVLRDMEELSTAETARILEIGEGAVRVRLHRARQALRTMLDQYFRQDS